MSDPKNENAGATPPEGTPAGEAAEGQTQATQAGPAADASEAQTQATPAAEAAAAQQPAAAVPPAYVAAPAAPAAPAGPRTPWYRQKWAVITGSIAAAVILFLGGMAVGDAISDNGRGEFGHDFRGMAPGGQGFGQQGWGDNGIGGGQRMMPPMGQGGQGYGHGWDQDGDHWNQGTVPNQAPSAAPSAAPSTAPQAYDFQ